MSVARNNLSSLTDNLLHNMLSITPKHGNMYKGMLKHDV